MSAVTNQGQIQNRSRERRPGRKRDTKARGTSQLARGLEGEAVILIFHEAIPFTRFYQLKVSLTMVCVLLVVVTANHGERHFELIEPRIPSDG